MHFPINFWEEEEDSSVMDKDIEIFGSISPKKLNALFLGASNFYISEYYKKG